MGKLVPLTSTMSSRIGSVFPLCSWMCLCEILSQVLAPKVAFFSLFWIANTGYNKAWWVLEYTRNKSMSMRLSSACLNSSAKPLREKKYNRSEKKNNRSDIINQTLTAKTVKGQIVSHLRFDCFVLHNFGTKHFSEQLLGFLNGELSVRITVIQIEREDIYITTQKTFKMLFFQLLLSKE